MKRPARRTIVKIIALLAAGAALNVAVAWGLAWSDADLGRSQEHVGFSNPRGAAWLFKVRYGAGVGHIDRQTIDLGPNDSIRTMMELYLPPGGTVPPPRWSAAKFPPMRLEADNDPVHERATGWPSLAMKAQWTEVVPTFFDRVKHAIEVSGFRATGGEVVALPLLPLWPGFAINTLFYAGVLWVLCCGPFALRRMIRRRRGQCPACAYPIGLSEVCTECGAEL